MRENMKIGIKKTEDIKKDKSPKCRKQITGNSKSKILKNTIQYGRQNSKLPRDFLRLVPYTLIEKKHLL